MERITLTASQAMVKFLDAQYICRDGVETKFVQGVFAIFGHGCCVGMGEALSHYVESETELASMNHLRRHAKEYGHAENARGVKATTNGKISAKLLAHRLKVYQGHNEQGMGHAAVAFAKQNKRKAILPCLSSIGPGATNMVTAAATATVNRIPALFIPGDTFASRQPDPVLQQLERFHSPDITVNDAFKPVCVFFSRITRPEQVMSAMLGAMSYLTHPAECGAVCVAFSQDAQGEAYAYPLDFFAKRIHHIKRVAPSEQEIAGAVKLLQQAKRPLIIAGGGARYSEAGEALAAFARQFNIPFAETQAGRSAMPARHRLNLGGIGVTGGMAANRIAQNADLLLTVGTRLSDFTTASKSAFCCEKLQVVSINVAKHDTLKLNATPIVADARLALQALHAAMEKTSYRVHREFSAEIQAAQNAWHEEGKKVLGNKADALAYEKASGNLSQCHALGLLQRSLPAEAIVVAASGSLPGDMQRFWQAGENDGYHMEYGYSCMGYEVSGALGVAMAEPRREVFVMVGDGAYVMMHSELLTAIQEGIKINIMLFDNSGFHCIDNLQNATGIPSYACQFRYRSYGKNGESGATGNGKKTSALQGAPLPINFAANAASYGCKAFTAESYEALEGVIPKVLQAKTSTLTHIKVGEKTMSDGYESWWRVGVPAVSSLEKVRQEYQALQQKIPRLRDY